MGKTMLVGLTLLVKALCRYFTKHQAKINSSIDSSTLTTGQKAAVHLYLNSITEVCGILEGLTGY